MSVGESITRGLKVARELFRGTSLVTATIRKTHSKNECESSGWLWFVNVMHVRSPPGGFLASHLDH